MRKGSILTITISIFAIMFIGQLCTLAPKFHGTVIILGAACFYSFLFKNGEVSLHIIMILTAISIWAEWGTRWLGRCLTKKYQVSPAYSINTSVCNVAGIIAVDALLGSLAGITIWELIVGKALLPYLDHISKVLIRLLLLAVVRFVCGIAMIVIACNYLII